MPQRIYLDHAATTEMLPEVIYAMEPFYLKKYGNASTMYELGTEARMAMEEARAQIAEVIGAKAKEIFFTSGGSESDNWAIKMTAGEHRQEGRRILTSAIEHHAILHSCEYLKDLGYWVDYLPVDDYGMVDPAEVKRQILRADHGKVTLISVMYANNEIGTIQPIDEIGNLARRNGIIFHTDAVQAVGQIPISVRKLPVDLLSASAHKFHGPKGVGFLYVREGVRLPSFIHGGAQEGGRRAGTENVAGIVGMARALTISAQGLARKGDRLRVLRNHMERRIRNEIPKVRVNGHPSRRLPGNLNISIAGVRAGEVLVLLDEDGISASAGSACNTERESLSHVISAIRVPKEYAYGTIRFSLGYETTGKEVDFTVDALKRIVSLLRKEG